MSAFDKKTIYENKAFGYERTQDFLSAEDAYESAIPFALKSSTKGALETTRRILFMAQIDKHHFKANEAGRKLMAGKWSDRDWMVIGDKLTATNSRWFTVERWIAPTKWMSESGKIFLDPLSQKNALD